LERPAIRSSRNVWFGLTNNEGNHGDGRRARFCRANKKDFEPAQLPRSSESIIARGFDLLFFPRE